MIAALLLGFLLGLLALGAAEAAALLWLLNWLRRQGGAAAAPEDLPVDIDGERPITFPVAKQGYVWVLDEEKPPRTRSDGDLVVKSKEIRKQKVVEVFPVKKFAKIAGHSLILSGPGGSQSTIELLNCTVVAVASSSQSSRKWAKRYPIRLESNQTSFYHGSKTCYLYADTSWEKESWCKALRLASTTDIEKWNWHSKLSDKFQSYISSLNSEYTSFFKPSVQTANHGEVVEPTKMEGSKVRLFLRKITRKASAKVAPQSKTSPSAFNRGERKTVEKIPSDHVTTTNESVSSQEDKSSNLLLDVLQRDSPSSTIIADSQHSVSYDVSANEQFSGDEGTLCWNLLFSRLFFDAKLSTEISGSIQKRIQRTLESMRTPEYIGDVLLTGFNLGDLPPYIHKMRVVATDLNELWAFEVDFEYSSGIVLDIETRLEIHEPQLQKDIMNTNLEPGSNGEVTSDLLDGIEHYGSQFGSSEGFVAQQDEVEQGASDGSSSRHLRNQSWMSRWKNMLHSIADHVSQVPLSLEIKITSVRGTVRIHIKPPPSDQLWYAFPVMPELDLRLESSIGERKITNSHISSLIRNRFKAALRESLVLPNCECICIPFMLGEKDDWVPRKAAPFIFRNHEVLEARAYGVPPLSQPDELKPKGDPILRSKSTPPDRKEEMMVKDVERRNAESERGIPAAASLNQQHYAASSSDLHRPLLNPDKAEDSSAAQDWQATVVEGHEQWSPLHDDDKGKGTAAATRRARMKAFSRRMGDKLEEKRRQIGEKGKNYLEKMRGSTTQT